MGAQYSVDRWLSPGLVAVTRRDHRGTDTSLWSRVKLRSSKVCVVSGRELPTGAEAYSPLGNKPYRYERIAADILDTPEDR